MTAPDPKLTDRIADHWATRGVDDMCGCGEMFETPREWAEHLQRVTNVWTDRRVAELTLELESANSPYPTQWAYDRACAALEKHRRRADKHEAAIAKVRSLAFVTNDGTEHEHNPGCAGERECPACWVLDILAALDGEL